MAKLGLVLVLGLLCFVLDAGANAGTPSISLIEEADLLFGVRAKGETSKEICTTDLPVSLEALHMQNLCLKASLPNAAKCSYSLNLAVSFQGTATPLFQAPIDLATLSACAGAANLTGSPIGQFCGPDVQVCVDFHEYEHGKASLRIGPDFVSGCPSIIVKDCKLPGATGALPPIPLNLGCFSIGEDCAQYQGCEQCLSNGCGWCTAGMRDNFKCMPGTKAGPACNGECGDSKCNCDWHMDTCPEADDELKKNKILLNETEFAITLKNEKLQNLQQGISNGGIFGLLGKEYECLPSEKARGESSGRAGITALVSILTGLVGLGAGIALGKAGYWDLVFNRGGGGDGGLDTGIYNRHDV